MDNNACLYPNEGFQNYTPLMEKNPENETYQYQNDINCQSKPPENIPINSNNFPYDQLNVKVNNIDYESFRINSQMYNYHIKQPNPYTFHISTGEKWLPLIFCVIAIILIISFVMLISGVLELNGSDGISIIAIIFAPCISIYLMYMCIKQSSKTYNADIIMMDNSLIIKSRSCCACQITKTYLPGQINGISIRSVKGINDKKLEILLSNNAYYSVMVLPGNLTDEEINYFEKVVNDYIKNKMRI